MLLMRVMMTVMETVMIERKMILRDCHENTSVEDHIWPLTGPPKHTHTHARAHTQRTPTDGVPLGHTRVPPASLAVTEPMQSEVCRFLLTLCCRRQSPSARVSYRVI